MRRAYDTASDFALAVILVIYFVADYIIIAGIMGICWLMAVVN